MKTIEKVVPCSFCDGDGWTSLSRSQVEYNNDDYGTSRGGESVGKLGCSSCGGSGEEHDDWYIKEQKRYSTYYKPDKPLTKGSGKKKVKYEVLNNSCFECNGIGKIRWEVHQNGKKKNTVEECEACHGIGKELVFLEEEYIKPGCFVTTAVCEILGKDDKCYELETLREFRDQKLLKDKYLENLVYEYYDISPKFVSIISQHPKKEEFSEYLFNNHIQKIVFSIENSADNEAVELYQKMLQNIEKKAKEL